jgi:putative mycofactocin binding protein MftB
MNPFESFADRYYRLQKGVRVRKENFGLLFYSRNGPKLTFVHTGPWMHPDFFSGHFTVKEWLKSKRLCDSGEKPSGLESKISRALSRLADRGLIVETLGDS